MISLKVEDASKTCNGTPIFSDVNLEIEEGEHVCLIGPNGSGKTTLLSCLIGHDHFDHGNIYSKYSRDEWGYLEQNDSVHGDESLIGYLMQSNQVNYEIWKKIHFGNVQSNELNNLYMEYSENGGFEWESEVEHILLRFEFINQSWYRSLQDLSGGERTRARLAKIAISKPKMLILDEPTNHLDIDSISWLANWIQRYQGPLLLVSHDRDFINQVSHTTYTLSSKGTKRYKGGYDNYQEQKEVEDVTNQALHKKQVLRERQLKREVVEYRQWFKQAHDAAGTNAGARAAAAKHMQRVRSKEKALERLRNESIGSVADTPRTRIDFPIVDVRSKTLLRVLDVSFGYSDVELITGLNMEVHKGDKIALMGKNGSGKSTILKLLAGIVKPSQGEILLNPQVNIGYIPQELYANNLHMTLIDRLQSMPGADERFVRTVLGTMLFRKDDVYKTDAVLSGGERIRYEFAKLYFTSSNLLLLDEPTNHLDLESIEILENSLIEYPGSVIIVSHDRQFLRNTTNRTFQINGSSIQEIFDET